MGHLTKLNEIDNGNKTEIFNEKIYSWILNGHSLSVLHLLGLDGTRKNRGNDKMRVKVVKVFSVNNLMNKDSDTISLMLDFLSKNCRD